MNFIMSDTLERYVGAALIVAGIFLLVHYAVALWEVLK